MLQAVSCHIAGRSRRRPLPPLSLPASPGEEMAPLHPAEAPSGSRGETEKAGGLTTGAATRGAPLAPVQRVATMGGGFTRLPGRTSGDGAGCLAPTAGDGQGVVVHALAGMWGVREDVRICRWGIRQSRVRGGRSFACTHAQAQASSLPGAAVQAIIGRSRSACALLRLGMGGGGDRRWMQPHRRSRAAGLAPSLCPGAAV